MLKYLFFSLSFVLLLVPPSVFAIEIEYDDEFCSKNYLELRENFTHYKSIGENEDFHSLLKDSRYFEPSKYDARAECDQNKIYIPYLLHRPFESIQVYFTFDPIELSEIIHEFSSNPPSLCSDSKNYKMLNQRNENVCISFDSIEKLRDREYLILPPELS